MKKSRHNMPIRERFERFFVIGGKDDCWLWIGTRNKKGYGSIKIGHKMEKAHRASFLIYKGPIPEGMHILHSCDNSSCVNPAHLSVGTNLQNQQEAWARDKKRKVRKLNKEQVLEIISSNESQYILAKKFGVQQPAISRIKNGLRGKAILRMS